MLKNKIVITVIITLVLIKLPMYSIGFGHGHKGSYSEPEGMELTDLSVEDGVYTGIADGFRPGLVVEVTVEAGKVSGIEIIQHYEVGRQYWQLPVNVIPGAIIEQEQTEVDVVSGATATSKAIMAAVENALTQVD